MQNRIPLIKIVSHQINSTKINPNAALSKEPNGKKERKVKEAMPYLIQS